MSQVLERVRNISAAAEAARPTWKEREEAENAIRAEVRDNIAQIFERDFLPVIERAIREDRAPGFLMMQCFSGDRLNFGWERARITRDFLGSYLTKQGFTISYHEGPGHLIRIAWS